MTRGFSSGTRSRSCLVDFFCARVDHGTSLAAVPMTTDPRDWEREAASNGSSKPKATHLHSILATEWIGSKWEQFHLRCDFCPWLPAIAMVTQGLLCSSLQSWTVLARNHEKQLACHAVGVPIEAKLGYFVSVSGLPEPWLSCIPFLATTLKALLAGRIKRPEPQIPVFTRVPPLSAETIMRMSCVVCWTDPYHLHGGFCSHEPRLLSRCRTLFTTYSLFSCAKCELTSPCVCVWSWLMHSNHHFHVPCVLVSIYLWTAKLGHSELFICSSYR